MIRQFVVAVTRYVPLGRDDFAYVYPHFGDFAPAFTEVVYFFVSVHVTRLPSPMLNVVERQFAVSVNEIPYRDAVVLT